MKSTWVKRIAVNKKRNEWVEQWVKVRDWSHEKTIIKAIFTEPSFVVVLSFSIAMGIAYFIHG